LKTLFPLKAAALASLFCCATAQANTTLVVTSFPSLDDGIKAAIPLYKKVRPDIDIKLVSLAFADHHAAMSTALASGSNLPDVMAVEVGFIGKFAESGGLEDLAKPPYSALQYRSRLAKYTVPLAQGQSGNLSAMPMDVGAGALFYRKDLLDKAGISEADLTKSWDSYIDAGKKLKASTGAYLIASAGEIKDILIRSGLKDGDGIYFNKKGEVLVTSPRFVKAFELAKAARTAGIDGKINPWSNEWAEGFRRGQIATEMMGSWLAGHLATWLAPDTKGLWRSAQLPGGTFGSYGGSYYAIPTAAKEKKEAWEFIKFLALDRDMQIEMFRKLDTFPVLIEAQNDPFLDQPIDFLGGQKARQLWKVAAAKIPAIAVHRADPVAQEIVNAELEKVLEQDKDIKLALADAKTQIERRVRRK